MECIMHYLAFDFSELLWGLVFWVVIIVVGCMQAVEKVSENEEVKKAAKDGLVSMLHRWFGK